MCYMIDLIKHYYEMVINNQCTLEYAKGYLNGQLDYMYNCNSISEKTYEKIQNLIDEMPKFLDGNKAKKSS